MIKRRPNGGNVSFANLYESMDHLQENGKEADSLTEKKMSKKEVMAIINKLSGSKISDTYVKGGGRKKENIDQKIDINALIGKLKENFDEDLGALIEGATENAAKSLQAILGMFKDKKDNDIYKMGKGIQDHYKKEGSFSPDQAKWIWKTSVALFKK